MAFLVTPGQWGDAPDAEAAAEALRAFDKDTDSVYASGALRPEHSIWDDEPDAGRAYVRQEYARWTRAERSVLSEA